MAIPFIERLSDSGLADFVMLAPRNPNNGTRVIEILPYRPNVDGHAIRRLARQSKPYLLYGCRNFNSMSSARVSVQHLREAIVGEAIDFTSAESQLFANLVCLDVTEAEPPTYAPTMVGHISSAPAALWGTQATSATPAVVWMNITVMHLGD